MNMGNPGIQRALAWSLACAIAIAMPASRASAQAMTIPTVPQDDADRPWAHGVSETEQAIARELYAAGNAEFTEARFAQALAKYREAVRHWDHPAIRFNMAVCLINLDQLIEAKDNLERSLAYRATPLGNEAFAHGLTYRKLIEARLAHITTTCSEPGAVVTLDGKYLFSGPGAAEQFLLPNEHQLAAIKPGFRTAFVTFASVAGKQEVYELRPNPEMGPPHWRYWKYVLGGGAVLASAGGLTYLWARSDLADYEVELGQRCPRGCDAETLRGFTDLGAKKDGVGTKQAAAFSLFAVGGAAIVVGVLGLILDQPRVRADSNRAVPVVAVTPGATTVALAWAF